MFGTTLQGDRDWICAPQGLVDGGTRGQCPRVLSGDKSSVGQPGAGAVWSPDSVTVQGTPQEEDVCP